MNRFLYTLSRSTHSYRLSLSLTSPYASQTRHKSNKDHLTPGQKKSEKFWQSVNEYLDEIPEPNKRVKQDFLKKKIIDEDMKKLSLDFMNKEMDNPIRTNQTETETKQTETLTSRRQDSNADSEKERRKDDKWRLALNFLDDPSIVPEPLSTYRGRPIEGPLNTFNTFRRKQRQEVELAIDDESKTSWFHYARSKKRFESENRFRNRETDFETESRNEIGTKVPTEDLNEIITETKDVAETETETKDETETEIKNQTETETKDETETETEPQFPQYTYKDASIAASINEYLPGIGTKSIKTGITNIEKKDVSFKEMLQNSNLMKMGDPRKKNIAGIVFSISGNQVYVDYGHKFYGVFSIPETFEKDEFRPGTKVVVKVLELELTQQFLGETTMFSLLESCVEFVSLL